MYRKTVGKRVCLLVFQQPLFPLQGIVNDVTASVKAMRASAWTLRIVRGSHFFLIEPLIFSKRSPLPLLSLGLSAQYYPQMTHALMWDGNSLNFPTASSTFPQIWKGLPTTVVIFWGKEDQKKRKNGSFFGLFSCCLEMLRIKMNPWEKLSIIADSSHYGALCVLTLERYEGQNSMHQVCNYVAKMNIFTASCCEIELLRVLWYFIYFIVLFGHVCGCYFVFSVDNWPPSPASTPPQASYWKFH